jgi:PAS domain S-box-containing protein
MAGVGKMGEDLPVVRLFELDHALRVVDMSDDLKRWLSDGEPSFEECFEVLMPRSAFAPLSYPKLLALQDRHIVLRIRREEAAMYMKGSIVKDPSTRRLVFQGSVWRQGAPPGEGGDGFAGVLEIRHDVRWDEKEKLSRLMLEQQRFEALFQFSSMAILVAGMQGKIVLANRMALSTFGYSEQEILGLRVEDLMPKRFRERHVGHRDRFRENPQNRSMGADLDLYAIRKDGSEFPVEISLGHYATQEGRFVIAYLIDITQRRQIEQAVLRQQEEMAKANAEIEKLNEELEAKVEQRTRQLQETLDILERSRDELQKALSKEKELSDLKSRFVSMASHEFRTPLSTILSSASLVAKYTLTEEQDRRDKHIQRIKSAVSNLTDILNEFLSIGKLEEGKVQVNLSDFNLKEQVQLVCNEMHSLLRPGQQIRLRHKGPETATLDLSLLRNVIINLVSNAIKFSPEGGMIDVETETSQKHVLISVRDYGIGISAEDRKHLFERFFRGKNAVNIQGTGLGLHIVSKYVELMQGEMSLESELEEGTTFKITFPK